MPNWKAIRDAVVAGSKSPSVGRGIAGGALGAVGGGLAGRYATPKAFGYADNPDAVNMSTFLDAALYGTLGALGGGGALKHLGPQGAIGLAGSIPAAELAPVAMDVLTKGRQAVTQASETARKLPISNQISDALSSGAGRGALSGAALAGLGAMTTGLTRSKSDAERERGRGRAGMVGMDFLKYVIPAMLAGGTVGHLRTRQPGEGRT